MSWAAPVGSIAGDVTLSSSGGRLADHAHDGRFVLVDRSPDGRFALVDRSPDGRFAQAVRPLEHRIAYVADPASDTSPPSLFVRPDGVIIWATSPDTASSDDAVLKEFGTAIRRWVGTRRESRSVQTELRGPRLRRPTARVRCDRILRVRPRRRTG
ncbi:MULTISPECIES: hypothetical protein [Streptomyces]|uniref:aromatic-ring hydroxylase C-terminal domain-containing protein n=1 Tax=Streptomyces TaxID=1883 RepID=UPI0031F9AB82